MEDSLQDDIPVAADSYGTPSCSSIFQPNSCCKQKAFYVPNVHLYTLVTTELLHRLLILLAWHQCKRHDPRNVHIRAIDVHVELELLTHRLDVLQTFLVVGSSAANPYLNLVFDKGGGNFAEGTDDSLECCGNLYSPSSVLELNEAQVIQHTFVKLAIPPPMNSTFPSGCIGARSIRSRTVRA